MLHSTFVALFVSSAVTACSNGTTSPATPDATTDAIGFDFGGSQLPDSNAGRMVGALSGCSGVESTGCHSPSTKSAGMGFTGDPAHDLAQLAGVQSTEMPTLERAKPNDVAHSWAYLKLTNATDAGVETAMPLGTPGDPAVAATLKAWIDEGAPNPFVDGGAD
ncbi:MAG: hypothetical protein ACHREM_27570 [Polyangiales bacterium]